MPSNKKKKNKNSKKNNKDNASNNVKANRESKADEEANLTNEENKAEEQGVQEHKYPGENKDKEKEKEQKNKVVARIFGEDFTIKGDLSQEEIKKIASIVDEKMNDVFDKYPTLNSQKIAILAALNIAEEYVRLENEHKELISLMDQRDKKGD